MQFAEQDFNPQTHDQTNYQKAEFEIRDKTQENQHRNQSKRNNQNIEKMRIKSSTVIVKEKNNPHQLFTSPIKNIKTSFLPRIIKSSQKFNVEKQSQRKKFIDKTYKIDVNKQNEVKNSSTMILHQPRSLQLGTKKQKSYKEEFYLPAFIRNFELPPRKKIQVVPTMDIFKKRQKLLKHFLSNPSTLKKYKVLSHIGKGSFSIVSQAMNLQTHKKIAMKTYQKLDQIEQFKFINIEREIDNMHKIKGHKNVVQIQAVVMDKRKLMLFMENCGQQSLAGLLRKKKVFTQVQTKKYFRHLLQGLSFCHAKGICHRDLKLENLLVDDFDNLKIIDFGFSSTTDRLLSSFCGTPPYMAPEIVSHKLYDGKLTDIWAAGIILYLMLYGHFPFRSNNENQLFRLIQQGKVNQNETISTQAKQIINSSLKLNPVQRLNADQLMQSKWFLT